MCQLGQHTSLKDEAEHEAEALVVSMHTDGKKQNKHKSLRFKRVCCAMWGTTEQIEVRCASTVP